MFTLIRCSYRLIRCWCWFDIYLWKSLNDIRPNIGLLDAKSCQLLSSLVLGWEEGSGVGEGVHETAQPVGNVDLAEEDHVTEGGDDGGGGDGDGEKQSYQRLYWAWNRPGRRECRSDQDGGDSMKREWGEHNFDDNWRQPWGRYCRRAWEGTLESSPPFSRLCDGTQPDW